MSAGIALYDSIGAGYDHTRRADPFIAARLASLLNASPAGTYLDLACGTGNYTAAVSAHTSAGWCGCDNSLRMLRVARDKGAQPKWCSADAAQLPFPSGTFNGALCTNAVHHFASLPLVLTELRRVLATGSTFVLFSASREQMQQYWLTEYFPHAMARSGANMPGEHSLLSAALAAGFTLRTRDAYEIQPGLVDHFLYSGKHDPARYLDAGFRAGISTFSAVAALDEVERGCQRLATDIRNGTFEQVRNSYCSRSGDYSFWTFEAA